jgi:hypothetical protein
MVRSGSERGYVAVVTAVLLVLLMGLCAFAVDVGNWYYTGQQAQRAADAAALAGVTNLPGKPSLAYSTAQTYSGINGFTNAVDGTTVTTGLDGRPTRLRVTVSKSVNNIFGPLLGAAQTTITRTAVADYAGPVPMGSPCNEFGNDPDATSAVRGSTCSGVSGQMWVNVNSPAAAKANGDAYQSKVCDSNVDGCASSSGPNTDYTADGYFYTISVKKGMPKLVVELFDPVFVETGLTCGSNFGSDDSEAVDALNDVVGDESTRYKSGADAPYCTGDNLYSGSQVMETKFTLRSPSANSWDPLSFSPVCSKTYKGHSGSLFKVLDQYEKDSAPKKSRSTYDADLADGFRRWTVLCEISSPAVGDYLLQVQSNVGGDYDKANAGNRFAIRATGADNNAISISGREKMGMYSNKPGAETEFYLARVPSGAAGQILNVNLFDVGDSNKDGRIKLVSPSGSDYSGCIGNGVTSVIDSDCSFKVTAGNPSAFNGKWQTVSIPIPSGYTCDDTDQTQCWVKLKYLYGSGSKPTDVTAWTASIEGDPVRLVE